MKYQRLRDVWILILGAIHNFINLTLTSLVEEKK
jgi:hypothetical protein